jgi:hypothetical protein
MVSNLYKVDIGSANMADFCALIDKNSPPNHPHAHGLRTLMMFLTFGQNCCFECAQVFKTLSGWRNYYSLHYNSFGAFFGIMPILAAYRNFFFFFFDFVVCRFCTGKRCFGYFRLSSAMRVLVAVLVRD